MKTTSKSTNVPAFFLGIDVGKSDLFCHLIGTIETLSDRFDNTPKGIKSLLRWLSKATASHGFAVCLEQTGHYGDAVAQALHQIQPAGIYLVRLQSGKTIFSRKAVLVN